MAKRLEVPDMPVRSSALFAPSELRGRILQRVVDEAEVRYEQHSLAFLARVYDLPVGCVVLLLMRKGIRPVPDAWTAAEETPASLQDLEAVMEMVTDRSRWNRVRAALVLATVLLGAVIVSLLAAAFM